MATETTVYIPSAQGPLECKGEIIQTAKGDAFDGQIQGPEYNRKQIYRPGKFALTKQEAIPGSIRLIKQRIVSYQKQIIRLEKLNEDLLNPADEVWGSV